MIFRAKALSMLAAFVATSPRPGVPAVEGFSPAFAGKAMTAARRGIFPSTAAPTKTSPTARFVSMSEDNDEEWKVSWGRIADAGDFTDDGFHHEVEITGDRKINKNVPAILRELVDQHNAVYRREARRAEREGDFRAQLYRIFGAKFLDTFGYERFVALSPTSIRLRNESKEIAALKVEFIERLLENTPYMLYFQDCYRFQGEYKMNVLSLTEKKYHYVLTFAKDA